MRTLLGALVVLLFCGHAHAQQAIRIPTCGTAAPPQGAGPVYMDSTGNLCTSASGGSGGAVNQGTQAASPTGSTWWVQDPAVLAAIQSSIPAGGNAIGFVGPSQRTLVTLNVKTVTTGGTAVTALAAGNKTAGGWIQNPPSATINLCLNEIGTATGTTSSGDTTCIVPGQSYTLTPSAGAVSVISSDSSHPFSGMGFQ